MKRCFALLLLLTIALSLLCACSGVDVLYGRWYNEDVAITFDGHGKGILASENSTENFTYTAEDDLLILTFEDGDVTDYQFTVAANKLTLVNIAGAELVFKKT